jgi:23S rRNA (uridine2552-2'-O)-methyltransferase
MRHSKWDDHYARRARNERWLARSVYKLQEIDKKYGVIKTEGRLLDLGCYPGSWSQYGIQRVGTKGEVVGLDLRRPERLSAVNFRFIQADVLSIDLEWLCNEVGPTDVVMSDLAPQTTGIKSRDTSLSLVLAEKAFEVALSLLKSNGHFVCKVFEGEDLSKFRSRLSTCFRQGKALRPSAVRKRSKEIYLLGLGLIGH